MNLSVLKRPFVIIVLAVSCLTYSSVTANLIRNKGWVSNTAYYNYSIEAALSGSLGIDPPNQYDLSHYKGHRYLVWGLAGALPVIPFYVAQGVHASDLVYTCVFALINCFLFCLLLLKVERFHGRPIGEFNLAVLGLTFALVSPNFFLGVRGEIWFVCQVVGLMYLLMACLAALEYWHTRRLIFLYAMAVFLGLTFNTRVTQIFYVILLAPFLIHLYWNLGANSRKPIAITTGIVISFIGILLALNAIRYGSPFDFGYAYVSPAFDKEGSLVSLKVLQENLDFYLFRHMTFRGVPPFIEVTNVGASIPSIYPITIGVFWLFSPKLWQKPLVLCFLGTIGLATGMEAILVILKSGFGWTQVGARYFYTILTLLYATYPLIIKDMPRVLVVFLVAYGALAQAIAIYKFY